MAAVQETVDRVRSIDVDAYKYGFVTDIESDKAPKGLERRHRPLHLGQEGRAGMAARMAARRLSPLADDGRAELGARRISRRSTIQDLYYFSAPKSTPAPKSLDEVDPELLRTYAKLGIPLIEQEILAGVERPQGRGRRGVRFGFGRDDLQGRARQGRRDLLLVLRGGAQPSRTRAQISRLGRAGDRQFLRDAEFGGVLRRLVRLRAAGRALPDGALDLFPHQREEHRPVRAHADHRRQGLLCQLSRRLHGAQARREPASRGGRRARRARRRRDQIFDRAELVSRAIREGRGGIYNFVTKRGDCRGARSKISWTQVETGSAITWKYPSCILRGDSSRGEFYSIAISNGRQQVDSGTKMIHLGKNTTSRIISKGIAAGRSQNTYRGQVSAHGKATGARNFTNCDSLLIGDQCGAHTVPYIEAKNASAVFEHEATTSKISEDQLFYCLQRGLSGGRGDGADRQRLRARRAAAIADGVRGRGAEADRDQPRGERRVNRSRSVRVGRSMRENSGRDA